MSHYSLQNDQLQIRVRHQGAELCNIIDRQSGLEYMWQAAPNIWGSHAPVLFPIIGGLKGGSYRYAGKSYRLPKHGMIRHAEDLSFSTGPDYIRCALKPNERTRAIYPFDFEFELCYRLKGRSIIQEHRIHNTGSSPLPFSLGGHPAFRVPLRPDEQYADYALRFEHYESAPSYQVNDEGLIANETRPGLQGWELPLRHDLFAQDALVLRNHRSRSIALAHRERGEVLSVNFQGWPYLGIWAKTNGDFVCIEPWLGLSDSTEASGDLFEKEGIQVLAPQQLFFADYEIKLA
ncbi:MAG: aldose 1-epimerase family protein [Bacteroidota bacterium]